jgi:hypothetical protein
MNRNALIALLAAITTTLAACGRKSDATVETSAAAARPVTVAARSAGSGDADLREINSYRLTMDDVRKWSAIKKKADAMKIEAKDTASNGADDDDDSLDGFEAKINATPKLKALIESEGMDPRDFAVVTWTMIQAAFIQMAVDQGASLDSLAKDKDINVENLKFLKAHEQEIDALQK